MWSLRNIRKVSKLCPYFSMFIFLAKGVPIFFKKAAERRDVKR
jgi:hypothetical protein